MLTLTLALAMGCSLPQLDISQLRY